MLSHCKNRTLLYIHVASRFTLRSLSSDVVKNKYSHTVILPLTSFSQRANSQTRELELQKFWNDNNIYENLRSLSIDGVKKGRFVLHDGPPYGKGELTELLMNIV